MGDNEPSNIFLRDGKLEQVTLLDFGVARRATLATAMTRTGVLIGTPSYMAPEQVRGDSNLSPAVDIFSLGCVLFECLTGQPPFVADSMAALMAKILFEQAPSLRSSQPELPLALDTLLAQMLDKDPERRLKNTRQLLDSLSQIERESGPLPFQKAILSAQREAARAAAENLLVNVLLASVPSLVDSGDAAGPTAPLESLEARDLRQALAYYGAQVEILAEGFVLVLLTQQSHMTATDLAAQTARCALIVRNRFPDACSILTTGRALTSGTLQIDEAIEQSLRLLQFGIDPDPGSSSRDFASILLDEVTAGLLDWRFEIYRTGEGVFSLIGERVQSDEARVLLGRPAPFVGRDDELAILDFLFMQCRDNSTARASLVLAPAGMGKSRLRHEFLRRLQGRNEPVQVLIGRGDPLSRGSPYAIIARAIRQLCGISDGEAAAAQQAKLFLHVQSRLPESEVPRVVKYIGDACGIPSGDSGQSALDHDEASLLGEHMLRAFADLFTAECQRSTVLLILEDLQWGDAPTVRLVDVLLRDLTDQPLMILSLARPEVEMLFPHLWAERRSQNLRLSGIGKRASERLVHQVLGGATPPQVVGRIIEQSAGNPLYLEELIRAVAEGKGEEIPKTVLAMLESRLLRLDPSARRLLRAASIYGQTFCCDGVNAILDSEPGSLDVNYWLQRLIEAEVIEPQREPQRESPRGVKLAATSYYRFRHALLRDAAYNLLTDEHRQQGHLLAARYLEQLDDTDPVVLAEHFERSRDKERAGRLYLRAAELSHRRGDAATAVAWARHGLLCEPDEIAGLGLRVLLCQVHLWRNEWAQAAEFAAEVMQLTEPGSPSWAIAATALLVNARYVHRESFRSTLDAIRMVEPAIDAISTMAFALAIGTYMLDSAGEFSLAESCLQRISDIVEPVAADNAVARGWMYRAHAHRQAWAHKDAWAGLCYSELAQKSFQEANHPRGALDAQVFVGMNAWLLGAYERAERELRATLYIGSDLGLASSLRMLLLVLVLCERSALDEAERHARALAEAELLTGLTHGRALLALGEVLYRQGKYDLADTTLRQALAEFAELDESPLDSAAALSTLAANQLAAGAAEAALHSAEEAMRRFGRFGMVGFPGARACLVYAEALGATGDSAAAKGLVLTACERIREQAGKIGDPALRQSFVDRIPEHRRLLALATTYDKSEEHRTSAAAGR